MRPRNQHTDDRPPPGSRGMICGHIQSEKEEWPEHNFPAYPCTPADSPAHIKQTQAGAMIVVQAWVEKLDWSVPVEREPEPEPDESREDEEGEDEEERGDGYRKDKVGRFRACSRLARWFEVALKRREWEAESERGDRDGNGNQEGRDNQDKMGDRGGKVIVPYDKRYSYISTFVSVERAVWTNWVSWSDDPALEDVFQGGLWAIGVLEKIAHDYPFGDIDRVVEKLGEYVEDQVQACLEGSVSE
ncbi:hypothetical protein P154DRAFT_583375 [Amniculicola lignicola CBS 123094]|uniref:Uncharacterized protein n=1 Tax=Amniculicola lignicola CBS 123094 TaxID=1392246 RepID=A0A6A5W5G7_9PLEO|nr:hypothetical protein P154DRAFT_583375 [Amniculicola lignicola CBS 123094]